MVKPLVENIGRLLMDRKWMVVTAESCTGGGVAMAMNSVPDSGKWFDRGFVTYSVESKTEMLGVNHQTLKQFGVVSEETALQMARGALEKSRAQIAVAITGLAGPAKGPEPKPVGTVCFAWCTSIDARTDTRWFDGERDDICQQSIVAALEGLQVCVNNKTDIQLNTSPATKSGNSLTDGQAPDL